MGKDKILASEVQKHNSRKSLWVVIKNDVYDVTTFLDSHPGGEDPLLEAAGMDATIAFEDVGHSSSARSMLSKYKIGQLAAGDNLGTPWKWVLLALAAAVIAGVVYQKYS